VGLIESLLTQNLVDGMMDDGKKGSTKRECIAQGLGNIASGITGGQGGCALVGQSIINVESGGSTRLAGMAMAILLGLGIVNAAPILGSVPIASLVGTMFLVCKQTFAWSSLRLIGRVPNVDIAIILAVSYITVVKDLAVAVGAGTVMSALNFAWKQSVAITSRESVDTNSGWKRYRLDGPLFFGSVSKFADIFSPKEDPTDIIVDFTSTRVVDQSALVAINSLCERYGALGKTVHLQHLSKDCGELLQKEAGGKLPPYELLETDKSTDPVYGVASD
jgi:sulfate permease, SulP family